MSTIASFTGEFDFLSNFHPAAVSLDRIGYMSVEHAYQAAKTLDSEARAAISRMRFPGGAKRIGRTVTIRADWLDVRLPIMRDLLEQKFRKGSPLWQRLWATAPAELIEGNTWGDQFWGVCKGVGENHLGKLLMQIRDAA